MDISQEQLKQFILDYLEKNRRMTFATSAENIPWIATVFFAYDSDLNLYFISAPQTRKTQNIAKNPLVAVAINEFINKVGSTIGLQIEGKCEMLDKEKNSAELAIFRKRFDWADEFLPSHELYRIVPKNIYYLDDEKFGKLGREKLEL